MPLGGGFSLYADRQARSTASSALARGLACLPKDGSERMNPPQWVDLVVSGVSVNPAGAVGGTSYDDAAMCQVFPNGSTTRFDIGRQINHFTADNSGFRFHLHGRFRTVQAGTFARFELVWRIWHNNTADPGFTTTVVDVPHPGHTRLRHFSLFEIPGAGTGLSALVDIQVKRLGAADSYNGDWALHSADGHVQVDRFGSIEEGAE